jgi:hypothetical protein
MQSKTVTIGKDQPIRAQPTALPQLSEWLQTLRSLAGLLIAGALIYIGWIGRNSREINPGEGLGYALGVVGGSLMLILLLYSGRKRIPLLRHLGPTRHWFRMHMMFGVVGPILILYHCNFQIGALNSRVALYCTLLVAASGLVGRYLYARIHHGLYGNKSSLRQLITAMQASEAQTSSNPGFGAPTRRILTELSEAVLVRPPSLLAAVIQPITLSIKTHWLYFGLKRELFASIDSQANASSVIDQHRENLRRVSSKYLQVRLAEIRRVAQFGLFERLFALWHVVHVPFFILLVLSACVHVLAVHMY